MQVSFRADEGFMSDFSPALTAEGGSSSKYAEPEAEGVKPVLRTVLT